MKWYSILFFLLFCSSGLNAQLDSLQNKLAHATEGGMQYKISRDIYNFYEERNRDSALAYAEKAIAIAKRYGRKIPEGQALVNKGYQLIGLGRFAEGLRCLLDVFEITDDPKISTEEDWELALYSFKGDKKKLLRSHAHHIFGILMIRTENVPQQIFHFTQAARIGKEIGYAPREMLAYMNLGQVYLSINKLDSVLYYERLSEQIAFRSGFLKFLGIVKFNIGDVYKAQGNELAALAYYYQAIQINSEQGNQNGLSRSYLRLLKHHLAAGNSDSALYYARKNVQITHALGLVNSLETNLGLAYEYLSKSYELNHQFDSAFTYLKLAFTSKDSLNKTRIKNLSDFQNLSFAEQLRLQNLEKEREQYENKIRTYGLLAGIGIVVLIAIILYRNNRQKHKTNKVLAQTLSNLQATQADLEIKNRELQIEAALERVRARAMAMQHSEELAELVDTVFKELTRLHFSLDRCQISIMDPDGISMRNWMANPEIDQTPNSYLLTANNHPYFQAMEKAWKEKQPKWIYHLYGDEKTELVKYVFTETGFRNLPEMVKEGMMQTTNIYFNSSFHNFGNLQVDTLEPLSDENLDILNRFGKVFDLTYTRFNDLQKAEAQAREAQIELGLERVRARAMSMQKSEELKELIGTVFIELTKLDLVLTRCTIMIYNNESNASTWWMANSEAPSDPTGLFIKYHNLQPYEAFIKAWKQGKNKWVYVLEGKDKNDWDDFLFSETELSQLPDPVIKGMKAPDRVYLSGSFNNFGCLNLATLEQLSDEQFDILLRFAKVFDLTYTRFNDLQKAEAQAREAKVEAGLERVRYSAMAMQSSEDVGSATAVVFQEISLLGVEAMRCGITVIHPDMTADVWAATTTSDGKAMKGMGSINFSEHPLWIGLFDAWKNKEESYAYELKGDDLRSYYKILTHSPNYNSSYIQNQEFPDHVFYASFFEQGAVFTFSLLPHDDEKRKVLKKFTVVFSLTFRRYLDLKQAEAQAREAKIEASLERVRSKAMAMHNSQDLSDTIHVFYRELQTFSITPRRCGVGLLHKESRRGDLFTWNTTEQGESLELVGSMIMEGHPVLEKVYEGWLAQTDYYPVLRGNEIKEYYKVIRPQMNFPDYANDEVQYGYFFFFNEGGVYAWTENEMKEDELQIYRRFTSVLSLTYKRYKDLQQAEANTREAQIEAALERVRSRTLAMQKSEELAETAAELFRQLIGLGIEPNRLYIGIVQDESGDMEMWATDEDGTHIGQKFMFNKNDNVSVKKLYDGWKSQLKSVIVDMRGKELEEYFHYLNNLLHIPFKDGLSQERRVQSVAYFSKGFIGMASPDGQGDQTIQLLERFAAVFNLTFTRFNDLKIAEAHAEQAELDLIQLKEEKKRTEDALNELQATQKQLIQSEKMASLGELTAGIAHEIQNPLNFVNNFSEVSAELVDEMNEEIGKGNLEDAQQIAADLKDNLSKINHHGKRAGDIVRSMLQHSRSSSGQKELTDINALCDEYLRLAYHGLRAKDKSFNASFTTDFDGSIPKIDIIPQDIGRVILNLINNAFYAVSARAKQSDNKNYQPTVTVVTKKMDQFISINVSDNGTGMPPHLVDKIFQPFFTTKPTGQGTGLGLSLSYDIVKAHGGELKVETKEGEGTEFIIQLSN